MATECEFPGCTRTATVVRPQRSGDILHLCGQPHVVPAPVSLTVDEQLKVREPTSWTLRELLRGGD